MNLLIWTGPVMSSNLNGVNLPPDTQVLTLSCTGSECAQHAMPLSQLLAEHGMSRGQFDKVVVSGFSAAHNALNTLLGADDDGDNRIDGAVLLDACFGLAGSPGKSGYAAYSAKAASGRRVMVFTASAGQNGPDLPPSTTGAECAIYNAATGAAAVGKTLSPTSLAPGMSDAPMTAQRAGNLLVLDASANYPSTLHGDMINRWGVATLNSYLVPILDGTWGSTQWWMPAVAAALGVAVGVSVWRAVRDSL